MGRKGGRGGWEMDESKRVLGTSPLIRPLMMDDIYDRYTY